MSLTSSFQNDNWVKIGSVCRAKGLQGQFVVKLLSDSVEWKGELELVQVGEAKFAVKKTSRDGQFITISVAGVDDRTAAEKLAGLEFKLPESQFTSESGETLFLRELLGFTVSNNDQIIGTVSDFSTNGAQDLMVVLGPTGTTYWIPFVEAFIMEIDVPRKKMRLSLPEGLLEINL